MSALILYEDFLRDLKFARNYSHHTLLAYKRDLAYYRDFCATKQPLQEFYCFLSREKLSARSQARVISCVRSYFKFLQRRGHSSPGIKRLKLPKIKNKLPRAIHLREFKALWKACRAGSASLSLRNQLVLSFLYVLACRVSELVALNIQDFNESSAWIRVMGKGGRQRLLPLPKSLYHLLIVYLNKSRPLIGKPENPALFFNNKGNRPSRVDIWRWLKAWSLKAGFNEVKNPHSFRHGCATGLLEKGADLRTIQKLLGHLSIQTTQIYTSVSSKKLKSAIDDFHPLSQMKKSS